MQVLRVLPLLKALFSTDTLAAVEGGRSCERGLYGAEPWPSGTCTTWLSVS